MSMIGKTLGHYSLSALLDKGFFALKHESGKVVAIKILK